MASTIDGVSWQYPGRHLVDTKRNSRLGSAAGRVRVLSRNDAQLWCVKHRERREERRTGPCPDWKPGVGVSTASPCGWPADFRSVQGIRARPGLGVELSCIPYPVKIARLDWNLYMNEMHHVPIIVRRPSPDAHGLDCTVASFVFQSKRTSPVSGCRTRHPSVILLAGWWDHSMILRRALGASTLGGPVPQGLLGRGTRGTEKKGREFGRNTQLPQRAVLYEIHACTYESQRSALWLQ